MYVDMSGQKLGQYELREKLGRGGMAEVYKAYQPGMDRFVAIKIMLTDLSDDDEFVERFRREAQSAGRLRHANIINIFDFGVERGIYYMAMEYIEHGNLKHYISEAKRLPPVDALRVAGHLASALAYAHAAGMIHRDLKPANIMFADAERKQTILTDFGIARILNKTGLTASGTSVGTPAYMSPEQALGGNTDARSDLYALGIILYEMLTGAVPYDADTPLAVLMKHAQAPLPTRKDYGDLIPEPIERLILQAMAKAPEDRFQTADEFYQAIRQTSRDMQASGTASNQPVAVDPHSAITEKSPSVAAASAEDSKPTTVKNQPAIPSPIVEEDAKTVLTPTSTPSANLAAESAQPSRKGSPLPLIVAAVVILALVAGGAGWYFFIRDTAPVDLLSVLNIDLEELPTPLEEYPDLDFEGQLPPEPANLDLYVYEFGDAQVIVDEALINGDHELDELRDELAVLVEEYPNNYEIHFAEALLYASDYGTEGQELAQDLIDMDPEDVRGYVVLHDAFLHYPNYSPEEATQAIETAYEIEPDNPEVLWRYSMHQNDQERAEYFQDAADLGAGGFRFMDYAVRHLYWDEGNYEAALPYLSVLYTLPTDSIIQFDPNIEIMQVLMGLDRTSEALDIAYDLESTTILDAEMYGDIAFVAYRGNDWGIAREWAELSVSLADEENPQYGAIWVLALLDYWDNHNFEAAVRKFDDLLAVGDEVYADYLTPEFGHTLEWDKARILADAGDDHALDAYNAAVEADDWIPEILIERAQLHRELGNPRAALSDLRDALDSINEPDARQQVMDMLREVNSEVENADANNDRNPPPSDAASSLNDSEIAAMGIDRLPIPQQDFPDLRFDGQRPPQPQNLDLYNHRYGTGQLVADVIIVNDRIAELMPEIQARASEARDNIMVRYTEAVLLSSVDGLDGGEELGRMMIDAQRDNVQGYIILHDALMHEPNYAPDDAAEAIQRAYEIDPENPDVIWRWSMHQDPDARREFFNQAEETGASGWRFMQYAANHLYSEGVNNPGRAIPYLDVLEASGSDQIAPYPYTAMLMGALMLTDQQADAFDIASSLVENNVLAPTQYTDIAYVAFRADKMDRAREWAEIALARDENEHAAKWVAALITYRGEGDVTAAVSLLDEVIAVEDEFYPYYLTTQFGHTPEWDKARMLADAGDNEAALDAYNAAIEADGWIVELYVERSRIHENLGEPQAARQDLNTAISMLDSPDAINRITDMLRELENSTE